MSKLGEQCEHGQLKRSCKLCELQEENEEMKRILAEPAEWQIEKDKLNQQIAALTRRIEQDATNWKILWQGAQEENKRLKSLLPKEMPNRKIIFKSCCVGHGRLVGENWIDPGCPYCKLADLQKENEQLRGDDKRVGEYWKKYDAERQHHNITKQELEDAKKGIERLQKEVEDGKCCGNCIHCID